MKIKGLYAREILDSLGNPTIECVLTLENGVQIKSSVPSGTSVGKYEAFELSDGNRGRYLGKGVLKAIENIETIIKPAIIGKTPNIIEMDHLIIELDGTPNKSKLGANATLAASIVVTRAQAMDCGLPLFKFINNAFEVGKLSLPVCMFNVLNGGVHADNGVSFQEFMIRPKNFKTLCEVIECAATIYHTLRKILLKDGLNVGVGHEGGFAPILSTDENKVHCFLNYLNKAIEAAGFSLDSVDICLDVASSEFFDECKNGYIIDNKFLSSDELVDLYVSLVNKYPIHSIEDGMAEDDWVGWETLTQKLGNKIQLVGDDVFVTNIHRIKKGVELGVANSVLIKPNQIGTVSETIQAIKFCKKNNYSTVISHRSGETNDSFIADLAVGTGAGQIKAGAPCRGERVAKYNRLMEIGELF
ncbi:MAG: Enolase [candidate division TM6 bacterium GW2011_GWF2_37_49]|nr:MAG: Enolase [candidate division TM6 bacterium GW2011_GWF2_37_49]